MKRLTNWLRPRPRRIRVLPARGRALVVSDLHGGLPDWEAFLAQSRVFERLAAGEDLWLILTGDVPDLERHKLVDGRIPAGGDLAILDSLLAAQASLGPRGERIVYVEGNHDFHVARVASEAVELAARERGEPGPRRGELASPGVADYEAFCAHYRASHGDALFVNNIAPYDMVPRASLAHLRFVTGGPVLVVMPGAGVAVTHAGPARARAGLRAEIERASAAELACAEPEAYFASAYHQLLNNRYRHGDYSLGDLDAFLRLFECRALVTGHTPHPYLFDLEAGRPLVACAFRHGVGLIADQQLVLCTSFGAFQAGFKRYLEFPLDRPFADAAELAAEAALPLYSPSEAAALEDLCRPLPGLDIALALDPTE